MRVSAGREFLSIPGPTVIPDAVLAAMQKPAVDIYAGPLVALTDGLLADMSRIFNTAGRSYIYAANGHGAWEAALTNVLSRGDKVLVLDSGRFAIAWGEAAKMLGAEVEVLSGDSLHSPPFRFDFVHTPTPSPQPRGNGAWETMVARWLASCTNGRW
jgi:alanine-glyoxylate transaminase / serine-glyoxylate transaminase / serine-pyruvate transaminase